LAQWSDLLDDLDSRMVVPLRSLKQFAKFKLPTRLTPVLRIKGQDFLLETPKMGAVPQRTFKHVVTSLTEEQAQITGALDLLFQGY
jgi:toxin CcdB